MYLRWRDFALKNLLTAGVGVVGVFFFNANQLRSAVRKFHVPDMKDSEQGRRDVVFRGRWLSHRVTRDG